MKLRMILTAILAFIKPMMDAILGQMKGKRGAELRLGMQVVSMLSDITPAVQQAFSEASPGGKELTPAEVLALVKMVDEKFHGIITEIEAYIAEESSD